MAEHLLRELSGVKKEISYLQNREKELKDEIHRLMTKKDTNRLVGDTLVCTRTIRTTRNISKDNVPENIWLQYSRSTRYPVLTLKKF
jgi:hypothetical protein